MTAPVPHTDWFALACEIVTDHAALILGVDMPSCERTETDGVVRDARGQTYCIGGQDEYGDPVWRPLSVDEDHAVWASEIMQGNA